MEGLRAIVMFLVEQLRGKVENHSGWNLPKEADVFVESEKVDFVDCGSSGQILYGKLGEYYLVPEVIKVNLLKNNLLTNKSKVSSTLLVPIK